MARTGKEGFLPLNEPSTTDGNTLFDEPCCWESRGQGDKGQDAVGPRGSEMIEEGVEGEAVYGATEATAGEDDAVGEAALAAEVLCRDHRDDLDDLVSNKV